MIQRILFLCMGNICRSPAAHCTLQHLVDTEGLSDMIEVDSVGTIGFHAGAPPDTRMAEAMGRRSIPVFGRSRQITESDLEHFDWIVVMDQENLEDIRRLDPEGRFEDAIRMFGDFCDDDNVRDVPDPYYGGDGGFERVLDLIEDGCRNIFEHVKASQRSAADESA